jgi:hypothetical protein
VQRHPTYEDPFRKRAARPRQEAAVGRFVDIETTPWGPKRPKEEWTEEERRGAAGLRAVRAVLTLTLLGASVALAVGLWRIFWAG